MYMYMYVYVYMHMLYCTQPTHTYTVLCQVRHPTLSYAATVGHLCDAVRKHKYLHSYPHRLHSYPY